MPLSSPLVPIFLCNEVLKIKLLLAIAQKQHPSTLDRGVCRLPYSGHHTVIAVVSISKRYHR